MLLRGQIRWRLESVHWIYVVTDLGKSRSNEDMGMEWDEGWVGGKQGHHMAQLQKSPFRLYPRRHHLHRLQFNGVHRAMLCRDSGEKWRPWAEWLKSTTSKVQQPVLEYWFHHFLTMWSWPSNSNFLHFKIQIYKNSTNAIRLLWVKTTVYIKCLAHDKNSTNVNYYFLY